MLRNAVMVRWDLSSTFTAKFSRYLVSRQPTTLAILAGKESPHSPARDAFFFLRLAMGFDEIGCIAFTLHTASQWGKPPSLYRGKKTRPCSSGMLSVWVLSLDTSLLVDRDLFWGAGFVMI